MMESLRAIQAALVTRSEKYFLMLVQMTIIQLRLRAGHREPIHPVAITLPVRTTILPAAAAIHPAVAAAAVAVVAE